MTASIQSNPVTLLQFVKKNTAELDKLLNAKYPNIQLDDAARVCLLVQHHDLLAWAISAGAGLIEKGGGACLM
jgi:hypothetical protein